jgi:hypothetical protein
MAWLCKVSSRQNSKASRTVLWLFCSIFIALLPIGTSYINGRAGGKPPGWVELLAGGELFLISAAIAADAIGKAFLGGNQFRLLRILCGVTCAVLLLATSMYFGRVSFSLEEQREALAGAVESHNQEMAISVLRNPGVHSPTVAADSLWLFVFTAVCALVVVIVDED